MSVGENIVHDASFGHVTGTSVFIDDRPMLQNEIFADILGSPVASGILKNINVEKALKIDGILGIYTHKDLHHKKWGTIAEDQPFLIIDEIGYMDEAVCIIAGVSREVILEAKKAILLTIDETKPILSIDEAIDKKSYHGNTRTFETGDIEAGFNDSDINLEGEFECGGQEHFYLESQAAIAYPGENGQIEIHSSSQHPTETQHLVAEVLGISFHQVVCVVKRMGGAFGGKESQAAPIAAYAAVVAQNLKRPARFVMTKDDDMMHTGKRHPYKVCYKVGFNKNGKINSVKMDLFSNAGAYTDLSPSILERSLFHSDSAYYYPNAQINGKCCKTNTYSNTAFRGFGGPQGSMAAESMIEDIANHLKVDALTVKEINLYQKDKNNTTPYGQVVENNLLPEITAKLKESSQYLNKRKEIDEFNKNSNTHVKGLSLTYTKFGIAFTAKFLNQGNALVNLHIDGSIQVSTGGTEMGQGLNTKIQQTAAWAFGINPTSVQVMPTSTEKNHNTSPTAASSGSDINCAATLIACEKIRHRMSALFIQHQKENKNAFLGHEHVVDFNISTDHIQYIDGNVVDTKTKAEISFKELCDICYHHRISLGDYAYFRTEGLSFDKAIEKGKAFNYFTYGGSISEVIIDKFTGEMKVLRNDILIDLGRMINPGIDYGQVSGAFAQGMGWVTTEKLVHSKEGKLLSHSPTTYKIPNIQDTPREFNINFIENDTTSMNVHRSKAVGEPPFLLGISVWTAIKNALTYINPDESPRIVSPATNEEILTEIVRLEDLIK